MRGSAGKSRVPPSAQNCASSSYCDWHEGQVFTRAERWYQKCYAVAAMGPPRQPDDAPRTIRIGLLGCGVVGKGVVELIRRRGPAIAGRLGARLEVARVF